MDYGGLYGMGSYYGEDYTASTLVRLATATKNNLVLGGAGGRSRLRPPEQAAAAAAMRAELKAST
jgi:nitric oxide reductase subunit B